jgi:hypothetical protein
MAISFEIDRPFPENAQRDIASVIGHSAALADFMESFSSWQPDFSPARQDSGRFVNNIPGSE